MSHSEQRKFCQDVKLRFPEYFISKSVLDVGSLDINGNNKILFDRCHYVGIDLSPGLNVDMVCHLLDYKTTQSFDVIITTESMEHDKYWESSLKRMVELLKHNGLLVLTCASNKRPRHGVPECDPESSPMTNDYYRNLSASDVRSALDVFNNFSEHYLQTTICDLYFWGIRK